MRRLDKINTCLFCGGSLHQNHLNRDHFYPRCVANKPENVKNINPFRKVIFNRWNVFRLCQGEHIAVDLRKISAFSQDGFKTLDPEGLVGFLMENYPVTENQNYRDLQLLSMINTNLSFVEVAYHLNGELPKDLVRRYQDAADLAWEFIRKLEILRQENDLM